MIRPLGEWLAERRVWWRIADKGWKNPLDARFAQARGGRWNPPGSFASLYLNEDRATARRNLRHFIARWPYEPEDLRANNGPVLVGASLPRGQEVCDAHTAAGIRALGLPKTYPLTAAGERVGHGRCQALGRRIQSSGLRGVRCRSAQCAGHAHRELAWFPATARSRATRVETLGFEDWFWGE